MKFKTPILISKWHMELEKKIQGPGKVVTKYVKVIKKLIKRTKEQKIYFFTKRLKTDLSYALWPLLVLKNNSTIDMAIKLTQQIEDNQKMHLEFTLSVFASVSVMASASQMTATFFAAQTQDPNEQLIDKLTANLVWLLELLAQALIIRCGEKSIVVKCCYWTTSPVSKQNQKEEQLNKSDDDKSNKKED
ncbi:hypothetical protein G9A89_017187 [Geosiphon pyriformis]|nr:hypothetical protein G9A89_017187 [Geosiphon pyriformis]